jgi:hypothetical protein
MFNPQDWYWLADDGRVFSSARSETVKETDKQFKAWKEIWIAPTRWPCDGDGKQTDEALDSVLHPYGLNVGLSAFKKQAIGRINDQAEHCRSKYITSGDGQMMTYLEKINQARACLSAQSQVKADYPMLAAEIGITAPTLSGVAEAVAAAYDQWIAIGSEIEAIRRSANIAIQTADTRDAVQTTLDNVVWPNGG